MYIHTKPIDLVVVTNFVSSMAHKWDMIGIQLHQAELVQTLKLPGYNPKGNLTQILQAAMESDDRRLTYGALLAALRSKAVNLPQVASELLKAAIVSERARELVQQPTNGNQQPTRNSPPTAPTDVPETAGLLAHEVVHT